MSFPYIIINWILPRINSRNELRKYVVLKFMEEDAGKGTGDLATRYRYNVEIFNDGRKLYLIRPAYRKAGFDFQIWMENWARNDKEKMPSYQDIIQDLKSKQEENNNNFDFLLRAINQIYICENDERVINWLKENNINFSIGENIKVLLKIIKWMFIEQDIRYWNFSGRIKLKNYIDKSFSLPTSRDERF